MNGNADRVEINGQLFSYNKSSSEPVQEVTIKKLARMGRRPLVTYEIPDVLPLDELEENNDGDPILSSKR